MPVIFLGIALSAPVTAYANDGGTGNRTATVTATSSVTWAGGSTPNLINGDNTTANSTHAVDPPNTTISSSDYIRFQFASAKYIDEFKIYQSSAVSEGDWFVQASNDALAWSTLASFTWNGATQTVPLSGMEFEGYTYYQIAKNGAGASWSLIPWILEFEFKIAAGAS